MTQSSSRVVLATYCMPIDSESWKAKTGNNLYTPMTAAGPLHVVEIHNVQREKAHCIHGGPLLAWNVELKALNTEQ